MIDARKSGLELFAPPQPCAVPKKRIKVVTEFSMFILFKGITPENSWLGGISSKNYKIIWKIKVRGIKTK